MTKMAAVTIAEPLSPGCRAGAPPRREASRRPVPMARPLSPRRARALARIGLVLVIGAAGAAVALRGVPLAAPERPPAAAGAGARSHVVEPGDTLWRVATELAPGRDPRPIVDALIARRGGRPLIPGETITWPR